MDEQTGDLEDSIPEPAIPGGGPDDVAETQVHFWRALDSLIAFYQAFDSTPRKQLKPQLKSVYDAIADLGARVGISRVSLGSMWKG